MAQGIDGPPLPPPESPIDMVAPFMLPAYLIVGSCIGTGSWLIALGVWEVARTLLLTTLIHGALHFNYDLR
jgi:hypothetical protein